MPPWFHQTFSAVRSGDAGADRMFYNVTCAPRLKAGVSDPLPPGSNPAMDEPSRKPAVEIATLRTTPAAMTGVKRHA